ncbi:helix-turn-helix domain-containing protein [Halorarum halophilum]|uniref:Helix-turn-helix domain-containing protein n=1 Tax=Halorarum halophilum TaxID=2743090 RepID=A0A7D5GJ72_9EURY|nr:helix-turn-helix domain-containing protein [Halobaculum halophilum]QLG28671.1 helix-turn-helix domain-containing protein [Halobaculum halophilum]
MAQPSTDIAREATCLRLVLDIWHPDCWTLEVTERTDAGLLGHGVYEVDGLATGRFTAFGDTTAAVAELIDAVDASPLTTSVRTVPSGHRSSSGGTGADVAPGNATRGLLVAYEEANSITTSLVSRGLIPDAPVRIRDGCERWAVLTDERRDAVRALLDEVRAEADAEVDVVRITSPEAGATPLFPEDSLSDRQREVFEVARERGYYERPRGVSAADLAAELGVSKATVLEHLRKAESKLLDPS